MDDWDRCPTRQRLHGGSVPLCDLSPRAVLHRVGDTYFFSHFRRSKSGIPFAEIKSSQYVDLFADTAADFLRTFIRDMSGWAIVTAPRRRHHEGFHFSSEVCHHISETLGIPFHDNALQCVNRRRIDPEFHLLREIVERKIILYDDIITTGSTMRAAADLFADREMLICLTGIKNR